MYDGLIERLEAATGPDRELDAELMAITHYEDDRHIGGMWDDGEKAIDHVWVDKKSDQWRSTAAHRFTSSLDECIAFLGSVLPGALWSVCAMEDGPQAQVIRPMADGNYVGGLTSAGAKSPAIALLLATLRALRAA